MKLPSYLPKSYFATDDDIPLFEGTASFAMCDVLYKNGKGNNIATFDLMVRDLPNNRNFMLLGGTEEIIRYVLGLRFKDKHIKSLLKTKLVGKEFARYLKKFKFSGDVYAMKEGTPFFPGEPIVRITGPVVQIHLFYFTLLNIINSNAVYLSKAIRAYLAAGGKPVLTNGGRGQGLEAGLKYFRAAYLAGLNANVQISALEKFKIPLPGRIYVNTFHSYIKSFPTEFEAMMAFAKEYPNDATFMVDTYGLKHGLESAIKVCQILQKDNKSIHAVYVDSGDLYEGAVYARKRLNEAGFPNVKVYVASNLNEWRIKELVDKNIPADAFMAITELVTSYDDPKMEVVYKMAEIDDGKTVRQTMKLAPGKRSLPGKKQVFRILVNGIFNKDVIGLEGDEIAGEKLLVPMIKHGELIYRLPKIQDIKTHIKAEVEKLPNNLKELKVQEVPYPVEISPQLQRLIDEVEKNHN